MVRKGKSRYCITGFPNLHELEIRSGKYGDFLGCRQYFNGCDYTEPFSPKTRINKSKYKRRISRHSKSSIDNLKKQTKRQAELREKHKAENKILHTKSSEKNSTQYTIISKTEDIICPGCGSAVTFNGKCSCS